MAQKAVELDRETLSCPICLDLQAAPAGLCCAGPEDVSLPQPEPKTRADFLRYSCEITLDPNTAYRCMLLSEGNRKATNSGEPQSYPDHPDRFRYRPQVLSRDGLTGRCYWEVELSGTSPRVAVAYKNISRTENSREYTFGLSDRSWLLYCFTKSYKFYHN